MPGTLQSFLATSTKQAAADLIEALERLPEDRRGWVPAEKSRSALDQVAECAMLNGNTTNLIQTRVWPSDMDFSVYLNEKSELSRDEAKVRSLLAENTARVIAAIEAVPDEDLFLSITTPFRAMPLSQIVAYPYWNMTYHQGQINYIASILGCLD